MASYRQRGCTCKPEKKRCTCGATWEFRISVTDPATGKRIQPGDSGFATKAEAKLAAAELKLKYQNGLLSAEAKDETVGSFVRKFIENVLSTKIEETSYDLRIKLFNSHIVPNLGKLKIKTLTPMQVQNFINILIDEGNSAGHVVNVVNLLGQAMKTAVQWGYIVRNPVSFVSKPKLKQSKITVWSKEQFQHFLNNTKESKCYAFYLIGLSTGMRPGEILGLDWTRVDFERKIIRVERTLARTKEKGLFIKETPKNNSSRRTIPIPDNLVKYLKKYKLAQKPNKYNLVFPGFRTDLCYVAVVNEKLQHDIKRCNLPHITPHDLRHTHATFLLSPEPFGLGQNVKIVSERLGHSKTSTTLNTYAHVLPTMQEHVSDLLNDYIIL